MPNILDYLNTISEAVYGKDVRQAIVDAISTCYEDGKAGVNDLEARRLIESAIAVNEDQQADIDTLYAEIAEIQGGGGESSQESTSITLDTIIFDGGFVDSVSVANNATATYDVTFEKEFTEVPEVFACVAVQNSAGSAYSKVTVGVVKSQTTTTGFRFFIANTSGASRSVTVVWAAFQPTTQEIDLDITIPSGDGVSEADVRAITNPIQTALNGVKTGYDGTEYSTPGEAVRTQINDLHVLIGDEPGVGISGSAVSYDGTESGLTATNMQGAVDELSSDISSTNERLGNLSDLKTEDKSSIVNAINEAAQSGGVTGIGISTIIALTQDKYDEIQTKDPATLYIITDGEGGGDLPSYSVTNSLTHVTTTNQATSVLYGNTYSATLIPEENYFIDSVTVRMKGVDITESVYSNGVINIPSVTGNISITAIGDTSLISVPYLDSDGNSYIVTDFTPDKVGLIYEAKMKNTPTDASTFAFGAYAFKKQQLCCLGNGSGWIDLMHDGVSGSVKVPNPRSGVHTYKRTATDAYIDDMTTPVKTVSAGSAISTNPFSVFAKSDGTGLSAYRLYYIKIYDTDGTTLLHEYVPAEHNGVACIYDTVNQKYFENQGTGSFTYGTELLG